MRNINSDYLFQVHVRLNCRIPSLRTCISLNENSVHCVMPTISDKSPWDTMWQIAFSLSFDTYTILLPSHHVKHPPPPPTPAKQCCFTGKYLCGLKTTLISGEEGKKDDFQKNHCTKTIQRWKCPNTFVGDCSSSRSPNTCPWFMDFIHLSLGQ